MKRFLKEITAPVRTAISIATIVVMTKGLYMNKDKKTAWYSNTKAANFQKLQFYFTTNTSSMKAEFIRLAVWLSMALEIFQ